MKAFWKKHKFYLLILLLLSIWIMVFTGYNTHKLGHDMGFHLSNIENLSSYLDFSKGHFLAPDISENIGSNLGYGLYLFYPSLPHLLYAYFYKFTSLFSCDILTSVLILNTLLTTLSTFFMYLLSYKLSKSRKVAFLTGLIFLLFPYRLSNYFIRYALNESLLFVFIPLVLLGLYEWKNQKFKSFFFYFVIGYIGMLYSHLMMTFYFTLILFPFLFYFRKELLKKEHLFPLLKAILVVTIFVSPILVSFFEHYQGEYLVYMPYYMTSPALVLNSTMGISSYFGLNVDDWSIQSYIPILVFLLSILSIIWLFRNKKDKSFYFILLVCSLVCIFLTTSFMNWRKVPDIFMMIQFPWRLLTFILIFISLYAPLCILWFSKKQNYLVLVITVFLLMGSYPLCAHIRDRYFTIEEYPLDFSQATGNMSEYFPIPFYRKYDTVYKNRDQDGLVIMDGEESSVREFDSTFPSIGFKVLDDEKVTIEFPRVYYKGYVVKGNGKRYPVSRSKNGLVEVTVEKKGTYTLVYAKTFLKRFVIVCKYVFLLGFCLWIIFKKVRKSSTK